MSIAPQRYTVEQYYENEAESDVRHEYFDGEVFAMAGGTAEHSLIKTSISSALRDAAVREGCVAFDSDMNVVCPSGLRTYPDASVTCGDPELEDEKRLALLNPSLVVEVLSRTTEKYDRGAKLDNYQTIESLKEVLFVWSDRVRVDHRVKQRDGGWLEKTYERLADRVSLEHPTCELSLSRVYEQVTLPEARLEGGNRDTDT
ncbi:MAG: Uma2 family endonuclease [Planctomycetota bacterium]